MTEQKCKIGMVGLGVMGRNLVLNIGKIHHYGMTSERKISPN